MKKAGTAAAKQSSNISQQRLTIGLDLVDRNSTGCWMKAARYDWSSESVTCAKCSVPRFGRAPGDAGFQKAHLLQAAAKRWVTSDSSTFGTTHQRFQNYMTTNTAMRTPG